MTKPKMSIIISVVKLVAELAKDACKEIMKPEAIIPSRKTKTKQSTAPRRRQIKNHQPDLPTSWKRLTITATLGKKSARPTNWEIPIPLPARKGEMPSKVASTAEATIPISAAKSANHQYSERVALPLKTTYFFRQVFTEVPKSIMSLHDFFITLVAVKDTCQ